MRRRYGSRVGLATNPGVAYTGGRGYKHKRGPNVPVISVVGCVDCPAQINERCVGPTGKPTGTNHVSRRRRAVRIYLENLEKEDTRENEN